MTKGKYQISFVNEGKPFDLGKWTVEKHKDVLKAMAKSEESDELVRDKKLSEEEKDDLFQDTLILRGLKDVDSKLKREDFKDMHPQDKKALFTAIYFTGREGITSVKPKGDAANFPK